MVIYEFRKNSKSKVTIELGEFNGREIIDVRVWFLLPGTDNEWKRTKKGIAMDIRHLVYSGQSGRRFRFKPDTDRSEATLAAHYTSLWPE